MSKKYLKKSEFRYDKNPKVWNKHQKGHVVYVSVRHGNESKINLITHSTGFFHEPTIELDKNPQINPPRKPTRPSRFSVPRWEKNKFLVRPSGTWHLSNSDKKKIHNFNRKYKKEEKV